MTEQTDRVIMAFKGNDDGEIIDMSNLPSGGSAVTMAGAARKSGRLNMIEVAEIDLSKDIDLFCKNAQAWVRMRGWGADSDYAMLMTALGCLREAGMLLTRAIAEGDGH